MVTICHAIRYHSHCDLLLSVALTKCFSYCFFVPQDSCKFAKTNIKNLGKFCTFFLSLGKLGKFATFLHNQTLASQHRKTMTLCLCHVWRKNGMHNTRAINLHRKIHSLQKIWKSAFWAHPQNRSTKHWKPFNLNTFSQDSQDSQVLNVPIHHAVSVPYIIYTYLIYIL